MCEGVNSSCLGSYTTTLLGAGWTNLGPDDYGFTNFSSPKGDIWVGIAYDDDYGMLEIMVSLPGDDPVSKEWPTDDIAALVDDYFDSKEALKKGVDKL